MIREIKGYNQGQIRKELQKLLSAWGEFLSWELFHNMKTRKFVSSFVIGLGLSLLAALASWWVRSSVYAQPQAALKPSSSFALAFPWLMGGGVVSVAVGVARANYYGFKRIYDCFVSGLALIILSPLFLIIGILIKMDSQGSVFFKQERLGQYGKLFNMWKFRTMRNNAELETGPVWAEDNDPRITRIGQFLRKSHLDELPQLLNVFVGDMSLIGPRPERPEFTQTIGNHVPDFAQRLRIRPGITGLAQVRYQYGASLKDAARKLKYDLLYIRRMCWLLDFQIIVWTLGRVLTGEGAR